MRKVAGDDSMTARLADAKFAFQTIDFAASRAGNAGLQQLESTLHTRPQLIAGICLEIDRLESLGFGGGHPLRQ
jgi:hypothetical protein